MQPSAREEYLCKRPRLGGRADFILMTDFPSQLPHTPAALPRRAFLRVAGASAATVGLALAGCSVKDPTPVVTTPVLTFGSDADTDKRFLNYLFFIKQLEYTFYDKVVTAFPTSDIPATEQAHFRDLRDHELVHAQVLKNLLGTAALLAITFDFTAVSLTSRASVLATAKKLEDTASGAFLDTTPLLHNVTLFTAVSKMASVEARHAAFISDLLTPGSFAANDVVVDQTLPNTTAGVRAGQAIALTPTQVVAVLAPFVNWANEP